MAWISACSRPRATSALAMISGARSARSPASAWSRCSFAIAAGGGVTMSSWDSGVSSYPVIAAPAACMSATGSDMEPQWVRPEDR